MRDATGTVQSVLVLGGTSEIGVATAKRLARERARRVILAARDPQRAAGAAAEVRALGAEVDVVAFDARDLGSHRAFVDGVFDRFGDIDLVLVAWGVLGDQERLARDHGAAVEAGQVN